MRALKPGGRAGLVLPDGTLFGEGVKTRIKEKLLGECNLHTIVRLPNGVFNPSSAAASTRRGARRRFIEMGCSSMTRISRSHT